ncbi:phage holin family protein [uncultured Desulfovibrio sp.]|uniref:phage holin family protein n=1 Tax=uncultured Desulfovibrio sp. TaxID=167968 RepID=UPI00261CF9F0|nr:phage holin family protein [uncultured Desulfovibrio sp.]
MTDPRWVEAFGVAVSRLADYWPGKMVIGSAITGACATLHMDAPLAYLCFGMLTLDMTTRVAVHCKRDRPLCRGLKRGIPRYICYLLCILLAWAAQFAVERALGVRLPVVDLIMAYLVLTDCASVIGHLHYLGVPVPGILKTLVLGGRRKIESQVQNITETGDGPGERR